VSHARVAEIPYRRRSPRGLFCTPREALESLSAVFAGSRGGTPLAEERAMDLTSTPSVEARHWLRSNPSTSAFAANRFGDTDTALAFVLALYARGATYVLVDEPGVDADGLPYADTLLVGFTPDSEARSRIVEFCEEVGPGDVPPGDFTMHERDGEVRLWWD
jgi:hypothetical protein